MKDKTESSDLGLVLKYQWFVGGRTPSNFIAVPDATGEVYWPKHGDIDRVLKVECSPILGETEYPAVFAISSPVSPGTGCPKVLKIDVCGELLEGKTIRGYAEVAWCGGTPGKGVASWLRRRWNSSPVVIVGAEDEEYCLTVEDIDSCLVFMYTPVTEEGAKGEPQYAITDHVKPVMLFLETLSLDVMFKIEEFVLWRIFGKLYSVDVDGKIMDKCPCSPPSVNNVHIYGDAVEGNTIRGVGEYFGGREGPSKFDWLRENKDTGDFVVVLTGTTECTLTKEDVGRRLAFVYIPMNFEGQEGKSMSTLSQVVKQAPPRVTKLKIIGDLREGSKVTVTGNVTGGTEGSSRVQWFKTNSSILEGENGLEAISTSKIAKAFRIPLGAVGYYIVAKFTPMTPDVDQKHSPKMFLLLRRMIKDIYSSINMGYPLEALPPSLNFLSITGDYAEDGILTASYGYIGGHEGKSNYNWYFREVETESGTLVPEASGLLQYRITKEAIGKFISFTCTPIRDDGIVGEPRTCIGQERVRPGSPRLLSLRIVGAAVEGTTLSVDKKYWGGDEGDSLFRWFRTSSDGTQSEVKDVATSSYTLSVDDIGSVISVSCEPVRSDWARGPTVLSEQIGPVIPGPPTCRSLEFLGSAVEGERLSFNVSYSGGEKGDCFFEWFRVKGDGFKEKLNAGDHLDLTFEDVGGCVELIYTPVRKDGVKGSPRSVASSPVAAADPVGVELVIPDCWEDKVVHPQKTYFGGLEGGGDYVWYRTRNKVHENSLLDLSNDSGDIAILGKTL
ncbi:hypothetical protein RJ640_018026 [Escallonia rubra]|uniref:AIR9-like A9 domain-containing protein n=1 Tax=Escallonia rubra TaxID=112253 RepID=A0AA88S2W0_9ASTE|nr:hypothetical protein RJ640_018026 [Escallonia rubra]